MDFTEVLRDNDFLVIIVLTQGDAILPSSISFALEYATRKVQEIEEGGCNRMGHTSFHYNYVNLLDGNTNTIDSRLSGGGLTGLRINRGLSGLNEN
jgi:hypothetical protein